MKRIAVWLTILVTSVGLVGYSESAEAAIEPGVQALWDLSVVPQVTNWPDDQSVEVGVRFTTAEEIDIVGVRFYKGDLNVGQHTGSLWDNSGNLLATGFFTGETADGWQDLRFDVSVPMVPGDVYVASYFVPQGYYSATNDYFSSALTSGPVTALASADSCSVANCSVPGGNGLYTYGDSSSFPEFTFLSSNYWVTPLWETACRYDCDDDSSGDDDSSDDDSSDDDSSD